MRQAHQVAKVRAAEGALMARVADGALMQRAAFGLASVCARLLDRSYGARVVVLTGSGDNGGDALYAGALLARRGARVDAVAAGSRIHPGGAQALREAGGRLLDPAGRLLDPAGRLNSAGRPLDPAGRSLDPVGGSPDSAADAVAALIGQADLILDGMLGIGGKGGLREPYAGLAARAAASAAVVVAVDLPSGIDADTGELPGASVRADVTVTFGTWKPGLLVDPAAERAGLTELVDIGLGPYLEAPDLLAMQSADVAAILPKPSAESDKYRRGVLGVVAGSDRFTGAAWLAVGAAIHGGAGMVRLVSAGRPAAIVRQSWPEAVITVIEPVLPDGAGPDPAQVLRTAGRVQAWTAGPGMGTGDDAAALLREVLAADVPVLVDADGLTLLAAHRDLLPRSAPTLLTPHAGELSRLLGVDRADVEARRLEHVRRAAAELQATVLLKGSTTVIATPDGAAPVHVNATGTPWLATAGSGDVLSGLAGSLLAQGLGAAEAAATAAYLHGLAARLAASGESGPGSDPGIAVPGSAQAPIGASDVLRALPAAIRSVQTLYPL